MKTEIKQLKETLSLLNSMIISGEQHSDISISMYEKSIKLLHTLTESEQPVQITDKKVLEKIDVFCQFLADQEDNMSCRYSDAQLNEIGQYLVYLEQSKEDKKEFCDYCYDDKCKSIGNMYICDKCGRKVP